MPKAARLNDTVQGVTAGEHSEHIPPHAPMVFTGEISGNVSSKVFINHRPAAWVSSITTERDACCGASNGIVAQGSSKVFIQGRPAARIDDLLAPHSGAGKVTSGSENVFMGT